MNWINFDRVDALGKVSIGCGLLLAAYASAAGGCGDRSSGECALPQPHKERRTYGLATASRVAMVGSPLVRGCAVRSGSVIVAFRYSAPCILRARSERIACLDRARD
jgi:hypothetical protein